MIRMAELPDEPIDDEPPEQKTELMPAIIAWLMILGMIWVLFGIGACFMAIAYRIVTGDIL